MLKNSIQRVFVFVAITLTFMLANCRSYNNGLVFYDLKTQLPYLPPTVSVSRGRTLASVKYSSKGSIWSTFGQPCDCKGAKCGCCAAIKVQQFRFEQKMCANVTLMQPKEETQLEIFLNEKASAKYGVSLKDPSPFCIPVMMNIPMAMCVQLSNIEVQGNNVNMCMDFIVRLATTDMFEMHFQCMKMGVDGVQYVDKNGQPVVPPNNPKWDLVKDLDSEEYYDETEDSENEIDTDSDKQKAIDKKKGEEEEKVNEEVAKVEENANKDEIENQNEKNDNVKDKADEREQANDKENIEEEKGNVEDENDETATSVEDQDEDAEEDEVEVENEETSNDLTDETKNNKEELQPTYTTEDLKIEAENVGTVNNIEAPQIVQSSTDRDNNDPNKTPSSHDNAIILSHEIKDKNTQEQQQIPNDLNKESEMATAMQSQETQENQLINGMTITTGSTTATETAATTTILNNQLQNKQSEEEEIMTTVKTTITNIDNDNNENSVNNGNATSNDIEAVADNNSSNYAVNANNDIVAAAADNAYDEEAEDEIQDEEYDEEATTATYNNNAIAGSIANNDTIVSNTVEQDVNDDDDDDDDDDDEEDEDGDDDEDDENENEDEESEDEDEKPETAATTENYTLVATNAAMPDNAVGATTINVSERIIAHEKLPQIVVNSSKRNQTIDMTQGASAVLASFDSINQNDVSNMTPHDDTTSFTFYRRLLGYI